MNRKLLVPQRQEIIDLFIVDLHVRNPNQELPIRGLLPILSFDSTKVKLKHTKSKNSSKLEKPNSLVYHLGGVEDVFDGEKDDSGVIFGAVHGERLAAAGLPVGKSSTFGIISSRTELIRNQSSQYPWDKEELEHFYR